MGVFSIFKKAPEKEAAKSPLPKEAAQKILDAASDARKEEKFRIAGVSFRQDDLLKFGSSNPDYSLKPSEGNAPTMATSTNTYFGPLSRSLFRSPRTSTTRMRSPYMLTESRSAISRRDPLPASGTL